MSSTNTAANTAVTMMLMQAAQEAQLQATFELTEEQLAMTEFAKRLIGRDVYVFMFNGSNITGRLLEVQEDAILLQSDDGEQIVSLRYVVRLREHPLDKRGNKKKIVL